METVMDLNMTFISFVHFSALVILTDGVRYTQPQNTLHLCTMNRGVGSNVRGCIQKFPD